MKIQLVRITTAALLGMLLLVPGGCRSKKVVEPRVTPTETPRQSTVSVPPPADFVVDQSDEERIDWSDLDELNRIAASRGWLRDAFYAYDSSVLTEEARSALADSARWLKDNPKYSLMVQGHCDERGTEQYNLALGERRSHIAREYMLSLGVDRNRIQTISYGKSRPFVKGSTEQSHAQNRRAHLRISGTTD